MAWWARLKGSALLETSAPQMRVELIPGQLAVQVSQHELPVPGRSLACWTFQSAGPMARGQKELVLTIARGEGERVEAVGAEIVKLLGTIWKLAGEGRIIAIGGFSEFGPPGILGEVRGIGYLRAQEMPGVAVPNAALAVVPLVAEEVDTVIWPHAGRRAPRPALQLLPLAAVVGPWSGGRWRGRRRLRPACSRRCLGRPFAACSPPWSVPMARADPACPFESCSPPRKAWPGSSLRLRPVRASPSCSSPTRVRTVSWCGSRIRSPRPPSRPPGARAGAFGALCHDRPPAGGGQPRGLRVRDKLAAAGRVLGSRLRDALVRGESRVREPADDPTLTTHRRSGCRKR